MHYLILEDALSKYFICHRTCCFKSRYRRKIDFSTVIGYGCFAFSTLYMRTSFIIVRVLIYNGTGAVGNYFPTAFFPLLSSAYAFTTEQGPLESVPTALSRNITH